MLAKIGDVPDAKLVARNTLRYRLADGTVKVRFHNTDIITIKPDGAIDIDTGGWNTLTTRGRLNAFLPGGYSVYSDRGALCINSTVFERTVHIDADGTIHSDTSKDDVIAQRKRIDKFMSIYKRRGLPSMQDSQGDPWVFGGLVSKEIMDDWIDTGYATRRLYILAQQHAGMQDVGVAISLRMIDDRGGKLEKHDIGRIRRYVKACLEDRA